MLRSNLFAATDLLEEGIQVLPLVLEEVYLLLPLLVVDRPPLALAFLDHLHLVIVVFTFTHMYDTHKHNGHQQQTGRCWYYLGAISDTAVVTIIL